MLRCNLSLINEWDHRWGYHPDSSSHLWTLDPAATAFLRSTFQNMSVRKEHDSLVEDQIEGKMQRKEIRSAVLNIENHSNPPQESESIEKDNGILGFLEMCGEKKPKTEPNTDPYLVINDHPAGRLLL